MTVISIITPSYYGKKHLNHLIEMIEQNNRNLEGYDASIEFVIVNDSPNEEINEELFKNYKFDYQIITNEQNCGIQKSRVNGLKKAKGEYALFLDQDDEIMSNCIASQYSKIKDYDVIVSNGNVIKDKKTYPIYSSVKEQKKATVLRKHKYEAQIVSPGLCLIKKDAIPKYWCDNILKNLGADDYFLWIIMLYENKRFTVNEEKLFNYHISGSNYSKDKEKMKKSALEACELLEKYDEKLYSIITKSFRKMQTVNYHSEDTIVQNALNLLQNIPIVLYKVYKNIMKKDYTKR